MPMITPIVAPRYEDGVSDILSDGMVLSLWTKPDLRQIKAYLPGSIGGQGLAFSIFKDQNQQLANAMDEGAIPQAQVHRNADGPLKIEASWLTLEEIKTRRESQQQYEEALIRKQQHQLIEAINKPYKPKNNLRAWVRTIGKSPLQPAMNLTLIVKSKNIYEERGIDAIEFSAMDFNQPIVIYGRGRPAACIIRASLSGYTVSASVITARQRPQWLNSSPTSHGIETYPAEVEVSYRPRDPT